MDGKCPTLPFLDQFWHENYICLNNFLMFVTADVDMATGLVTMTAKNYLPNDVPANTIEISPISPMRTEQETRNSTRNSRKRKNETSDSDKTKQKKSKKKKTKYEDEMNPTSEDYSYNLDLLGQVALNSNNLNPTDMVTSYGNIQPVLTYSQSQDKIENSQVCEMVDNYGVLEIQPNAAM